MNRLNSKQLYAHGFYSLLSTYHTHTREMALNIWHWGDPKKNFNWEKNWQSIHFAFLRGVDKYIIIHAHGHQPQEEKLAFKKVAGSSAAKWRLVLFGYASFQSGKSLFFWEFQSFPWLRILQHADFSFCGNIMGDLDVPIVWCCINMTPHHKSVV